MCKFWNDCDRISFLLVVGQLHGYIIDLKIGHFELIIKRFFFFIVYEKRRLRYPVKITHFFRLKKVFYTAFLAAILSFSACDPADGKNVPLEFTREHFDEIVQYALNNYIDPETINVSRAYVGAAEASLSSLPYPLVLMPESFYQNRQTLQNPDRIIPGKVVKVKEDDPYVILVPDYKSLEKKTDEISKKRRAQYNKMSRADQLREADRIRKEIEDEKKHLDDAWAKIAFSKSHFNGLLDWIDANKENYSKLPETHTGEDPFKDEPFDMNYVYFSSANGFLLTIDPHSGVLDTRTWDKIRKESEDSSFEGIGALLRGGGNNDVVVETPLANSPALRSGLRAGDIIRKVDGSSIVGLPLSDVVRKIRGPKETTVVLSVERPPVMSLHDVSIVRSVIEQKAVSSEYDKEHHIGVIKVSSFLYSGKETSDMVVTEYRQLMDLSGGKMDGLVLDLRNNPGGFLGEAIHVAGLYLEKGSVVVQTRGRGTPYIPRKSNSRPVISSDLPVVVLINAGSASASEIVASALMDHNRALILGERSFGKASVQEMTPIEGTIIVKLTTQRYYAPEGYTIQVYGVKPDIELSDEADGSFPPKFREEDMWKHLPELQKRKPSEVRSTWVEKIKAAVGNNSDAEVFIKKHQNDARRPDYMLIRALPYLNAMKANPHPE